MNVLNRQEMVERETKYLPYKSYRNDDNKVRRIQLQSRERMKSSEPSTKVQKSSKQKSKSVERQLSAYRGDINTVHCVNSSSGSIKSLLKHSKSLTSNASFQVYEKLKDDLAQLREVKCKLDEEIIQLTRDNEELRRSNEELRDQYELNSDQMKELLMSNDRKEELLRQLESTISGFQSERDAANLRLKELENLNRELENNNNELTNLVSELHSITKEKDRIISKIEENDLGKVTVMLSDANLNARTNGEVQPKNEQPPKIGRRTAKVKGTKHSTSCHQEESASLSSTNSKKDKLSSFPKNKKSREAAIKDSNPLDIDSSSQ